MTIDLFKTILSEFLEDEIQTGTIREQQPPINNQVITTIIGGRRTGKTTLLKQIINSLLKKGIPKKNIIYINFEDERIPRETSIFQALLEAYAELYPFSFREYLLHKKYNPEKQNTTTDKALLRRELQHYLEEGGYPETIGQSASTRAKTLKAYLDVMIYRDLIERYNITNHNALKQYIKKMLANSAREASIHKTFQEMKSQGYKISKDHLYNYQDCCEEINLLFQLHQYHESLAKQQAKSKKIYGIDTGLINSTSFKTSQDKGRIIENIVFLELKRREKERIIQAIQVTLTLEEETTRKREMDGLIHALNKYKLTTGTIITLNEEGKTSSNNKTIIIQPLWKWLLEKERTGFSQAGSQFSHQKVI